MRPRTDPNLALLNLAAEQAGVLTREQLLAHGLSDESVTRLLRHGWWQRLESGLYYCESGTPPWLALAWGGVLLGGDDARLGAEAAAHLHGLLESPPELITVLVPHGIKRTPRVCWQFIQERDGIRRRSRGAPPRLDVEDAVLDLCDGAEPGQIVDVTTRAVQTRRTTPERLSRRLAGRPRHGQRKLLCSLLGDVAEGAESPLELRYVNDVERPHGLPRGRRQHRSRGTAQDVYYEDFGAVIELDGIKGHHGTDRHRDMRRDNRSTMAGDSTLRYGWWDVVERPCLVAAEVAALLRLRGWSGVPDLCPQCDQARSTEEIFR